MWKEQGWRSIPRQLRQCAQNCDIPQPPTYLNGPQEETQLLAGAWEDWESVTEPAGMAGGGVGGESINTSLCFFESKLPYEREMAQSRFHALPADLLCFRS